VEGEPPSKSKQSQEPTAEPSTSHDSQGRDESGAGSNDERDDKMEVDVKPTLTDLIHYPSS